MTVVEQRKAAFDEAAEEVIEMGNSMLDEDADSDADAWEVASGLLAGAIQFWLFSRQPCDDPFCEACADVSTSRRRLDTLLEEVRQLAEESDYFDSPYDVNVGTA